MKSIQKQLSLATALTGTVVFVIATLVIYTSQSAALWSEFDHALEATARSLAADVEQKGNKLEFEIDEPLVAMFADSPDPKYFQAWVADSDLVVAKSASLHEVDLPRVETQLNSFDFQFLTLNDRRSGRLAAFTFLPPISQDPEDIAEHPEPSRQMIANLVVAADTTEVDRSLAALASLLCGVSLLGITALIALQMAIVHRGLQPLKQLESEIEKLNAQNLTLRLSTATTPRELLPVVSKFNELLNRLDTAFEREKSFTADVAHELRTPVAGLRAQLEVALIKDRSSNEYKEFLESCQSISQDMQGMIETLLAMARLDGGGVSSHRQVVCLADVLSDCWQNYCSAAETLGLTIDWQVEKSACVLVDPQQLRVIINNLFDNVISHCNPGGHAAINMRSDSTMVTLTLRNSGCRVASADGARIFDRLWRGDPARAVGKNHSGLGLTIVQKLVTLNGGTIRAKTNLGDDFEIFLEFPEVNNKR